VICAENYFKLIYGSLAKHYPFNWQSIY